MVAEAEAKFIEGLVIADFDLIRICGNKMLQITRIASECKSLQCNCGHLVGCSSLVQSQS